MRPLTKMILALLPLFIAGLACSKLIPGKVDLFAGSNAADAAAAIKKKVGTEKVNVTAVELRSNKMRVTVQSQQNPKERDEYTYENGSVTGPDPVKVPAVFANYVPHATEIGEINFAAVPKMIERAIQLADAEGAKVDLLSMDNQYASTANPQLEGTAGQAWALTWRIFVDTPRVSKYYWADKDGKLNEKTN